MVLGTYGILTGEPTVPLISSTGTKYCEPALGAYPGKDCVSPVAGDIGLEYQTKSLATPGVVIVTELLVIEVPVWLMPTLSIGAGLQVVGWQTEPNSA